MGLDVFSRWEGLDRLRLLLGNRGRGRKITKVYERRRRINRRDYFPKLRDKNKDSRDLK